MLKRFVCAIQFLTRFPTWPRFEISEKDYARSMAFFPLVGLLIGLILAGTYLLFQQVLLPEVIAVLILLVELGVSGALHLDGFMDTMDGLFCGRSREQRLEILRDSRVGAHSVISVCMLFLLKWSLLLQLQEGSAKEILWILLVMPAVGRLNMVLAVYFFPYVRKQGLGKAFAGALKLFDVFFAIITTLLAVMLLLTGTGTISLIVVVGLAMLAALAITRLLGGLTGDIYGWLNETSEVTWLLIFILLRLAF